MKYKKISVAVPLNTNTVSQVELGKYDDKTTTTTTTPSVMSIDEEGINVIAVYDNVDNLTEVNLTNIHGPLPRSLIQIIGLLAPSYDYLTTLKINRCNINSTIIYEISKMLQTSYLTDICLDGSSVLEGIFFILLDYKNTRIKRLSLCRCKINDVVCREIATRLHFLCPAEQTLSVLNLSSNHITDEGAKHLGEALRSNRRLRYLNLADNRIGEDGAGCILNTLMEFCLTYDENMARKQRLLKYLRDKNIIVTKYLSECEAKSEDTSQFSRKLGEKRRKPSVTSLKNKSCKKDTKKDKGSPVDDYTEKAEMFALGILGPLKDPFNPSSITVKDLNHYSTGNFVLCYLNLSYNQLTYPNITKLLAVLQYQRNAKKHPQTGLLKVVIEGNPIPATCLEYHNINELSRLAKSMNNFGGRVSDAGLKKRRATRISLI